MRNAQELIGSKLAGALDDCTHAAAAADSADDNPVAHPAHTARYSNTRNRIVAIIAHLIMAAAAALGVPYGFWLLLAASAQGDSNGTVMVLQPLMQAAILHVTAHASWSFAEYEGWSSPRRLHVVMAVRLSLQSLLMQWK